MTHTDYLVTALTQHGQTYVLRWRLDHPELALRQLGRWASDPSLQFTWFNAAEMSAAICHECQRKDSPCLGLPALAKLLLPQPFPARTS